MNNKSFTYEQSGLRQAFVVLKSTRSYPSSLKTYIQYVKHSQRVGGRGCSRLHELVEETDAALNPYARLFMILWALGMMAAVGFQSGKAANVSINKYISIAPVVTVISSAGR
ncbi:hypothetical protein [Spirosoma aerophilum]